MLLASTPVKEVLILGAFCALVTLGAYASGFIATVKEIIKEEEEE